MTNIVLEKRINNEIWNQVRDKVWHTTWSFTSGEACNAVSGPVYNQAATQIRDHIFRNVGTGLMSITHVWWEL